jgi:hypothetical protein
VFLESVELCLSEARLYESETFYHDLGPTLDTHQPGLGIENIGIKVAVGLLVVSEIFTVESELHAQDIGLGVLGNAASDNGLRNPLARNKDLLVGWLSETDHKSLLAGIFGAEEVNALDVHGTVALVFDRPEGRRQLGDVWRIEVGE